MSALNLENFDVNQHGTVKVLNFFMTPLEKEVYNGVDEYSDIGIALFRKFCDDRGIFYYARTREDFSEFEAYNLAEQAGNEYLIMEDMS